jgi:3-deoxy-D-manno-octulosonic-acid transferase
VDPVERLYDLLLTLSRPVLPAARLLPPKLARAIEGRRAATQAMRTWAGSGRNLEVPLAWLHAASAGELGGAVPVLDVLRRGRPETQVAITVSSPSGLEPARALAADFAGYAPLDTLSDCGEAVRAVQPDALVFVKLDMWPGLSRAAAAAGVPLGMINGTVRPDSSRLRSPTRQILRSTYSRLEIAGVVGETDAVALEQLGVDPGRIRITGDAAFDQALARVRDAEASGGSELPGRSPDRVRLVAGSTWPADEEVLLDVAREIGPELDLVLVPHEPSSESVRRIDAACRKIWGRGPVLWSELTSAGDDTGATGQPMPMVVDTVGLLAELYTEADLAFVGGAFDATGLHSVIEPAAASLPVLFGPLHDRREADELLAAGAAEVVGRPDATERIRALIGEPDRRRTMGEAGRSYVESEAGAAEGNAKIVSELLDIGLSRRTSRRS